MSTQGTRTGIPSLIFFICLLLNTVLSAQHLDHHHLPGNFCKVEASPDARPVLQPDGTTIMIRVIGRKSVFYAETLDGYTILKDPQDQYYKYAVQGLDGDLFVSNVKVSPLHQRTEIEKTVTQQLALHLRYSGKTLRSKNQQFLNFITQAADGPSHVFPPTGTRKALLLLIDYPDQPAVYLRSSFDNLANQEGYSVNGNSGSFRDYYKDISYNSLIINTDVKGWYRAAKDRATYGDDAGSAAATGLVREAVDAAEAAGVNFSQYDGDNDGKVDVVMIIHSGRGAEESGDGNDIWSHRWVLSGGGNSVTYDGKLINDYIIQPEKYGPTNITNIGVLCHEFGHALGLPDLYDTDGTSRGIGRWCCMAGGTWNNSGKTPAQFSIWCKEKLGWIDPVELNNSGTINGMTHTDIESEAYRFNTPVSNEYFLVENRQKTGWDSSIPGEGLLIYHIDDSKSSNSNENQPPVLLEQADGDEDLQNKNNSGDTGDPFPGATNNTLFNNNTNPNSKNYNGSNSGIAIHSINTNGDLINFSYGSTVNCTGTPNPGNTMSTEINPCSGHEFTLSMSTPPYENGISYQWQLSPNASSWENMSGAVASTTTTAINNDTWFRCLVTCSHSGTSAYSSSLKISTQLCYCDAAATHSGYEKISGISFASIDNSSSSTIGYEDFTGISANVTKGQTYSFTATLSNSYATDQILVWIDFNNDGDFTDNGENVYTSSTGTGPHTSQIVIPSSTSSGMRRMRVRLHDTNAGANSQSCGNSTYGQVEDYTLNIQGSDGGNCEQNMVFSSPTDDITSGHHSYEVMEEINAANKIMGGNVTYNAGTTTQLMPNFEIQQGAELTIMVEGCSSADSP